MKKLLIILLCMVLLTQVFCCAAATEQSNLIYHEETVLENDIVFIDEIFANKLSRASLVEAQRRLTIKSGDTLLGVIVFEATFRYDGVGVYVVSKEVIQTDTYEGYSYKQNSFTSLGGTVTLEGKITKLLIFNHSFTMILMCDEDGNVSAA